MKTNKKFDSVKMMRDARDIISLEIKDMSSEQMLDYIKRGRHDYEELIASHKQTVKSNREIKV